MNVRRTSTSSSTISEVNEAGPTTRRLARRHGLGPEGWEVRLRVRVETEWDHLADVESEKLVQYRRHHDLVGAPRVNQTSLAHLQAILGEEQPVDAGHRIGQTGDPDARCPIGGERARRRGATPPQHR